MRCENRAKVEIGGELLCKGGKVEAGKITDYGLRSTEDGFEEDGYRKGGTGDREGCVAGTSGQRPQHNLTPRAD